MKRVVPERTVPPVTKLCTGPCGRDLPFSEFFGAKAGKHGLRSKCKECSRVIWKKWMDKNRESYRKWKKDYFADPKNKRRQKDQALLRQHGITIQQYEEMLGRQNGACALCLKPEESRDKSGTLRCLSVDHDHDTGVVRGLLCFRCNTAIGVLEKRSVDLGRLGVYLSRGKQ